MTKAESNLWADTQSKREREDRPKHKHTHDQFASFWFALCSALWYICYGLPAHFGTSAKREAEKREGRIGQRGEDIEGGREGTCCSERRKREKEELRKTVCHKKRRKWERKHELSWADTVTQSSEPAARRTCGNLHVNHPTSESTWGGETQACPDTSAVLFHSDMFLQSGNK